MVSKKITGPYGRWQTCLRNSQHPLDIFYTEEAAEDYLIYLSTIYSMDQTTLYLFNMYIYKGFKQEDEFCSEFLEHEGHLIKLFYTAQQ